MIVIAVEDLDVDAGLGHFSRNFSKLARFSLVQSLYKNLPLFNNPDARGLQRIPRLGSILNEKVGYAVTVDDPCSSPLNAYPSLAKCLSHVGQCARAIFE